MQNVVETNTKIKQNTVDRVGSYRRLVGSVVSDNINLSNKDRKANSHGDGNDGKINSCKVEAPNSDVLPGEDVSPEQASEGSTKCSAERAIVDTNCHAVHGRPECTVRYWGLVYLVDFLPSLDDAGEENCGADIGAGKLQVRTSLAKYFQYLNMG